MTDLNLPAYDTYVNQAHPDHNYGDSSRIRLSAQSSNIKYGYIKFPHLLPTDATVTNATLTLYCRSAWSGSNTLTAQRVKQKWKESQATYTNKATSTGTGQATAVVSGGVDRQAVSLDVTVIVQTWLSEADYGFRLDVSTTSDRDLYSSEYADLSVRPSLTISYVLPPDAPRNLRPDGSRAVSSTKPLLLWDSDTPASVQIQLDNNSDFSSPLWDPGYVATTLQQYDPAALTALTDNTRYFWHVRIKDENGVESEWSDAADFYYRSLGTLAVSAPSGSTVTTNRPTFTHALTGRTQAYTSYSLTEDGVLMFSRPKLATTATSFDVPAGYVRDPAAAYVMAVRVWDNFDRESVGTAKDYTETTKAFTLTTGATTAPTDLSAVQMRGHVHLTWSCASVPDAFTLEVDGVAVFADLDPADLTTGGTAYSYDYYRARPWVDVARMFGVKAEVASVLSAASTATMTFQPLGIWLVDEESGAEVQILGKELPSADMGEAGATFFPIGTGDQRVAPVRIVDSIRGFEGEVVGELATRGTQTAQASKNSFEYMKTHVGTSLRLLYGRRNIPVVIGSARLELVELGDWEKEAYGVSFEYWQTGEFSEGRPGLLALLEASVGTLTISGGTAVPVLATGGYGSDYGFDYGYEQL